MHCIICVNKNPITLDNPFTIEHIFTDSIGGQLVLKGLVCKFCNNQMGIIDSFLANHPLILIERHKLLLTGKGRKVPEIFDDFKDELGRVVKISHSKIRVYPRNLITNDPLMVPYLAGTENSDKIIDNINKKLKRMHNSKLSSDDEQQFKKKITNSVKIPIQAQTTLNIDIIEYHRSILKIAYELAFYWLGERYANDPMAEKIRLCLIHPQYELSSEEHWSKKHFIRRDIGFYDNPDLASHFKFWDDE